MASTSLVLIIPMPHKHNAERRHHIPKMSFKVQNWPAYEAGLGVVQTGVTREAGLTLAERMMAR